MDPRVWMPLALRNGRGSNWSKTLKHRTLVFLVFYLNFLNCFRCRGPNTADISGNQLNNINATGLTKGKYVFQLTACDAADVKNNDTVTVTVLQSNPFERF